MLQIRQIRIGDYRAAYRLIRQAFGGSNISDGHEQDWVIAQRSGKGIINGLRLWLQRNHAGFQPGSFNHCLHEKIQLV